MREPRIAGRDLDGRDATDRIVKEASSEPLLRVDGVIDRAFEIDGLYHRLIAATCRDSERKRWFLECLDLSTGSECWRLPLPGQPFKLRTNAVGDMAALTIPEAGCVLIVDTGTGKSLETIDFQQDIYAVAW